jgi:hypothetical protein
MTDQNNTKVTTGMLRIRGDLLLLRHKCSQCVAQAQGRFILYTRQTELEF